MREEWEGRFDKEFPLDTEFWEKLATCRAELKLFISDLVKKERQKQYQADLEGIKQANREMTSAVYANERLEKKIGLWINKYFRLEEKVLGEKHE